jgi:hypothetical protein
MKFMKRLTGSWLAMTAMASLASAGEVMTDQ